MKRGVSHQTSPSYPTCYSEGNEPYLRPSTINAPARNGRRLAPLSSSCPGGLCFFLGLDVPVLHHGRPGSFARRPRWRRGRRGGSLRRHPARFGVYHPPNLLCAAVTWTVKPWSVVRRSTKKSTATPA